jgi:hypothetical protein
VKVLALIYGDERKWEALDDEERQAKYDEHRAFAAVAGAKLLKGAELARTDAATTVRVRDGQTVVTDGPFAETKEQLGGFYVLDCGSVDEAVELATHIPEASDGTVELRAAAEEAAA